MVFRMSSPCRASEIHDGRTVLQFIVDKCRNNIEAAAVFLQRNTVRMFVVVVAII